MILTRRKASALFTMEALVGKQAAAAAAARRNNNLSVFTVVLSVFLFATFIYNEDVKSIAEFPFSSKHRKSAPPPGLHHDVDHQLPVLIDTTDPPTATVQIDGDHITSTDGAIQDELLISEKTKRNSEMEGEVDEEKVVPTLREGEQEDRVGVLAKTVVSMAEGCDMYAGEWEKEARSRSAES